MVGKRLSALRKESNVRPANLMYSLELDAPSPQDGESASAQTWRHASVAVEHAVKQLRRTIRKRAWRNRVRRCLDLGRNAWNRRHG